LLRAEAGITRGDPTIPTTASEIVTATTTSSKPVSTTKTISIQPQRSDGTTQTIGVMLSPNLEKIERLKSDNPIVAFKLAFEYLSDIFTQTLLGTVSVLASFISPSGSAPGQKISGPIGLIQQGSSVVATKDWTAVWLFAAGLSVNLGVINALPLPALDGGQLAFVIAEAISGKKIDQKFQEGLTSVAVLFLLWLSVSAAVGDVSGLVTGTK
jgi:RIP metalloprotease RseP